MSHRVHGQTASKVALLGVSVIALLATGAAWGQQTATTLTPVKVEGQKPLDLEKKDVLDQEQIDREQPMSLKEVFRDEPAITVPGGSTAAQKIYLHGIDQNKLNVTVDGAPQRNNIWHHNGNTSIDPLFLKTVEVESGVSAADSGPGALGGSIRFKTRDARDMLLPGQTTGGTAILGYDTNSETFRTTGAGYTAQDGFDLLGIATLARGSNYENGRGTDEPGTGTGLTSGLAKLGFEALSGHHLRLSTEYVEDDRTRRLRPNMGLVTGNPTGSLLNSNRATRMTTVLSYETAEPTDHVDPKVDIYYNHNALERPNDNNRTTAHGAFNSQVNSWGGKLQNAFVIPGGSLTVGIDYNRDDADVERFHFSPNISESIRNIGAYAQARVSLQDDWRVSTGLRGDSQHYEAVDNQTFDNAGVSPNLSTEYDLTGRITGFGGYSYNFGGIEMAEVAQFHAGNYTYDPNLNPSHAHNMKAGLRYSDGGLALEGTVFRTEIKNPTAFNYTSRIRINGDDLVSKGFDLAAGYQWQNAYLGAKYTYTDVRYGDRIALPSDYSSAVPVGNLLTLRGHYTFEDYRLTLGGSSEMASRIDDSALAANSFDAVNGYAVFNLFTEWQPLASMPHWSLRLEANNLLDAAYLARSSYHQTGSVTPVLEQGRSFYLSTTVKF